MVSVPCYRCNRYHRIVSLDKMLSHHKGIVLKSSRPSLPLKKAPPLISVFSPQGRRGKPPSVLTFLPLRLSCKESSTSNQAFLLRRKDVTALQCCVCPTCPSPAGGSLTHSQALALSKRARDVTALRCSEPLRSKDGGPSKVFAILCGLGPPGDDWSFIIEIFIIK